MARDISTQIIKTLKTVLPNKKPIALHEPVFIGNEWKYLKQCLDTGWVSSAGSFVDDFERKLEKYTGIKYAISTVNGTAALHISLLLAGVKPGDEVLVPALTFVATANAVSYCEAIPHFVDSSVETLGVDPEKLDLYLSDLVIKENDCSYNRKTKRPIRALVVMHTFGHPVKLEKISRICKKFNIILIEDAAEALGSTYKGRHVGHWGKLAILSFNGNKVVTTGGGGAILTNDSTLAKMAKHLTTTAKAKRRLDLYHDMVGYNYRLPNLNAALGCAQLENLPKFLKQKRLLASRYEKAFKKFQGLKFFIQPEFAESNYWLNALILDQNFANEKKKVLRSSIEAGIITRPAWTLMHQLPMYESNPRMDLSTSEDLVKRIINIPSSASLVK